MTLALEPPVDIPGIIRINTDHWIVHGITARRVPFGDGPWFVLWSFGRHSSTHQTIEAVIAAVETVADLEGR